MKVDLSLLSKAFSTEPETANVAKDEIIELNDIEAFYECITHARELRDDENLEFWLIEVATSRTSAEIVAKSLVELTLDVFIPQKRFNEALVYLKYLQGSVFGQLHKEIIEIIGKLEIEVDAAHAVKYTENWKTYDLSVPLQSGLDQQEYYDRFLAYFHATNDSRMSERVDDFKADFLPKMFGYFIGLSESLNSFGVQRDTAVKAYVDFLSLAYPKFRPGLLKTGSSTLESSTPVVQTMREERIATTQKGYGISKR